VLLEGIANKEVFFFLEFEYRWTTQLFIFNIFDFFLYNKTPYDFSYNLKHTKSFVYYHNKFWETWNSYASKDHLFDIVLVKDSLSKL